MMMKLKQGKKWITAILCTSLLSGLCACGKKETGIDGLAEQPSKGRYVETQETLPEELGDWTVKQMFEVEDKVHLLAAKREGEKTVLREWAGQGQQFEDVTQDWLAAMTLPCEEWSEMKLIQGGDNAQYLFAQYVAEGTEGYTGHLWRGEGETAEEITPKKWTTINEEWGSYEYILGVTALNDGTLAAYSYTSIDLLKGEDGSLLESEPLTSQYGDFFTGDGENIYLGIANDSGGIGGIEKRRGGKESGAVTIPFSESSGSVQFCPQEDGSLIAACTEGIFRCQTGTENWEKLLDGMETDFGLTDCWCKGIAALSGGRIYALFQKSGGELKLNKYEYDPDAVIEVTERLKLYTVHESYLLNQAAALYHREHPEVLISIQYAYPRYYYDEADYDAVYQELNTMLMGDGAPDIMVMDHLNMDSYAGKGLLENINDVVEPLEKNGELLSNITGAYVQENGSRYAAPLQFGFYIAAGRDIKVENMASMEALADFLAKETYSYMGSMTVSELVDKFYPHFCEEIVSGKQLNKEALDRNLEYVKAIAENSGIINAREKDEKGFNMWDLPDQAKLAFEEADGFKGCLFPMSIVNYIKGDFTAFDNSFIPSVQMGICAKSRYKDTAKDFLRFALSETIQDTDYYSGFPVRLSSLEKQSRADRSEAEAETAIMVDGGYEVFQIKDYSEDIAERLVTLCKGLDKPVKEDSKIREVLIEALEGYLTGDQSKEETIQKIESGLKMYLAE